MKKFLSILLASTMVFGFSGCGSTEVVSDNKLVIGLDDQFPPLGFRSENNEIVGFDIDLANAAAEKMGVEIEFQKIDWSTKEIELESGTIDLLWNGLTMTDERIEAMEFTKPYLNNKQVIVVKEDSPIQTKDDLAQKNIGLQQGSTAVDAVAKDPIAEKLGSQSTYEDNILALTDLEVGRVDAVVADEVVVKYYLDNNDKPFRLLEDDFGDEVYGVAAKKGNTELVESVQKALDELGQDGTAAEISQKWFGADLYLAN